MAVPIRTAKACVAVANRNARIDWALLAPGEPYRRAAYIISSGLHMEKHERWLEQLASKNSIDLKS